MTTWAAVAIVGLGLLWRTVRFALGFPLWGDEAFVAVNLFVRDLAGLFRAPLEYWQVAPYGFLASEWLVGHAFGMSERSLRLLPFLAGVSALLLFWWFVRRNLDRWSALTAVGIFATAVYPVRHATEVKPYAIDLLLSLVLTTLGWSLWRDPHQTRRWGALIGLAAVGVWMSNPFVFTAGGVGLLLTARVWREPSPRLHWLWLAFGAALVGSWLTMMLIYGYPHTLAARPTIEAATWEDAYPPVWEPWRMPWWLLKVHTGYMLAYPLGGNSFGSAATCLSVIVGSIVLYRVRRPLLFLLLSPLALNLLAAALHRYPYGTSPRISLFMAPAFCLLAGVGIAHATRRRVPARYLPAAFLAITGALAIIPLVCIVRDVVRPYSSADEVVHRQIARTLAARTSPRDEWLVFTGFGDLPEWDHKLMLARWLQQEAEFRFYLHQQARWPLRWVTDPLRVSADPTRETSWFIVHKSGYEYFPDNATAYMIQVLTTQRGRPSRFTFPVRDNEVIEVYAFPPARTQLGESKAE